MTNYKKYYIYEVLNVTNEIKKHLRHIGCSIQKIHAISRGLAFCTSDDRRIRLDKEQKEYMLSNCKDHLKFISSEYDPPLYADDFVGCCVYSEDEEFLEDLVKAGYKGDALLLFHAKKWRESLTIEEQQHVDVLLRNSGAYS